MKPEHIIIIKKEDNIAAGIFFLLAGIGSVFLIGVFIYGLIFDNYKGESTSDYLSILIPLIIGSLIVNQIALWRINGKDIIKVYDNFLTIQSKGSLFHLNPKSFRFEATLKVTKIEKDVLGIEKNNMLISGLDGFRKFGQGLTERQVNYKIEQLNKLIEEKLKR